MKRVVCALLPILGIGAAVLFGADFWQKKKFPEWDEKEVRRMLSDSPWARPVEVTLGTDSLRPRPGVGGGHKGGPGAGGDATAGTGGVSEMPDGNRGGGGAPEAPAVPAVTVTVRFHSALPIKQAAAKSRYGKEVLTSTEATQMLSRQETYYIVGMTGLPPQLLRDEIDSLKDKAQLRIKGKPTVYAKEIRQDRSQGRLSLYLFFAREGNPIVVEDGEVEVRLGLGGQTIKRAFKLKDMVYEGKLEI